MTPAAARLSMIRRNPLESILLFVAVAALCTAMVTTAKVALTGDRTQDLTFAGATDELARTLATNGPERVGRLARATIIVGGDTASADTIVVAADSIAEPAVAKGGFVHDQIAIYNDHAMRQAVLGMTQSARWERSGSEGASLLRTVWTEDGTRRLSDRPSPYAIAIRSPYAEGTWREVRTTDWRTSPGLLGYDGEVALPADLPAGQSPASLNGRPCSVRHDTPRFLMYCRSALGAEAGRFYDFGFEVNGASANVGSAFAYRQHDVWMNGRAQSFGKRSVHGGDVLDVQWLGPFVLSAADWGTLAAEQWINGRRTFANQRLGTVSFFARAGRSIAAPTSPSTPLVLSFDAALAADLDREAARFMSAKGRQLARMAVVVLDVRSGEIKAIAEPARASDDEALLSFEPLLVGSVVKPIIAAALLSRQPALADLRLAYAGDTVTEVAGIPLTKGFANATNGCAGDIGFVDFLRCSSNQYAAELMVRSLQRDGYEARAGVGPVVPRARLETSALATGLADAFDVDAYAGRTRGRLALYWNPDSANVAGAAAATTDRTLIPWESRPWIVFPDSSGTRVDLIARYAFGGWENRWTLLGVAQAFARISTDRNVQATFLHREGDTTAARRFPPAAPRVTAAFTRVRGALRQVGVNGTAAGLTSRLEAAVKDPIVVMTKTGTLNEGTHGGRIKSLAIAMGVPVSATESAPLGCGLVAVTYFEFADTWQATAGRTALPRVHLDFAEGPFAAMIGRHWARVARCAPPTKRVNTPLPPTVRK